VSRGIETLIPAANGAPDTPAYAVLPERAERGVVVIHELFGRRPEIDRVVERFGARGYAAVAPDLFDRGRLRCLVDVFRAMRSGKGTSVTQGRNARAWLRDRAGVPEERIGLIGFCFGGGYALLAGSGWAAVSTNYGPVPLATAMRGIGPVIGCYGSRDRTMARAPDRLRRRLGQLGHEAPEIHVLDAGHSFLTDAVPKFPYNQVRAYAFGDYPEARDEGWRHIDEFFDQHLRWPASS
jgi:carboxymethylenebutenolidase